MFKTIVKLFAFKKAPKKTAFFLAPIKTLKWGIGLFVASKLWQAVTGGSKA
ncbi:MAG: hypothetical protein ACOC3J_02550 [Gemmatimonadota bacterium]